MLDQSALKGCYVIAGVGASVVQDDEYGLLEQLRREIQEQAEMEGKRPFLLSRGRKGFDYLFTQLDLPYALFLPHTEFLSNHWGQEHAWSVQQMVYGATHIVYTQVGAGLGDYQRSLLKLGQKISGLVDELFVYEPNRLVQDDKAFYRLTLEQSLCSYRQIEREEGNRRHHD